MPDCSNIRIVYSRVSWLSAFVLLVLGCAQASLAEDKLSELTGSEIVAKCGVKEVGLDQRSRLTVVLQNPRQGAEKRSVYRRYWKAYGGKEGVFDKMLLFTEYPPDALGSSFMRVAYEAGSGKEADQWIYLPLLKKIRRVTIRDQGDSFLNSDLAYADVEQRALDADQHNFLGVKKIQEMEFYQVESIPKDSNNLYGRRLQWFLKGESWDSCASARIDYFSKEGALLKEQYIKWQEIDGIWIWDRVLVRNALTGHISIFVVSDVEVNVGLADNLFSARTLRMGQKMLNKKSPAKGE